MTLCHILPERRGWVNMITVTFMFYSLFSSLARSRYLSLFSLSFNFTLWSAETAKLAIRQGLFFFFTITWSLSFARDNVICLYLKTPESFVRLILQDGFWVVHIPRLNFLLSYQWITFPTLSCLVLNSFCANLVCSIIVWLIVSSLSPHNQYLLFYCVLFILSLIWLVLMAFFCAVIKRDSVYLSYPCPSLLARDFACLLLEISIQ